SLERACDDIVCFRDLLVRSFDLGVLLLHLLDLRFIFRAGLGWGATSRWRIRCAATCTLDLVERESLSITGTQRKLDGNLASDLHARHKVRPRGWMARRHCVRT